MLVSHKAFWASFFLLAALAYGERAATGDERAVSNGDAASFTSEQIDIESAVQPFDCANRQLCTSVMDASSCGWAVFHEKRSAGQCGDLPDPVERRMCELGIFLDGYLDDVISPTGVFLPSTSGRCDPVACGGPEDSSIGPCPPCSGDCPDEVFLPLPGERAIGHIDRVSDGSGTLDPGCWGVLEQPLRSDFRPSGFNIGSSILWFVPDDDIKYCSDDTICSNDSDCAGGSCEGGKCVGSEVCIADDDCGAGEVCVDVDRSLLYVAWDLSRFTPPNSTRPPSQYDADGDGSACRMDGFITDPINEFDEETYIVFLRSCADINGFDPRVTFRPAFETRVIMRTVNDPLRTVVTGNLGFTPDEGFPLATLSFPTADGATNRRVSCIDEEVRTCTGKCSGNEAPCANFCQSHTCASGFNLGQTCVNDADCPGSFADAGCRRLPCRNNTDCAEAGAGLCQDGGDCPMGESCVYGDNINNVELVIKRVETSGYFGPHSGLECSGSGRPCGPGIGCPAGEGDCNELVPILPGSARARQNRLALSQLEANLFADTNADGQAGGDEEDAMVALRTRLPDIEVSKLVRCADEGESEFSAGPVDAFIGSTVEYQITIQNFGNTDLEVTVKDVLEAAGAQADFAACDVVCDFIEAELTSPRRELMDVPVDFGNASSLGLEGLFFTPTCAITESFLGSIQDNSSAVLGTLLGAELTRDRVCTITTSQTCTDNADCPAGEFCETESSCRFFEGDSIVIRFRSTVGTSNQEEFCDAFEPVDCVNSVSVRGTFVGETEVVARDESGRCSITTSESCIIDDDCPNGETCELNLAGDNVATVNILCRDITFMKAVGFPDAQGSFVTGAEVLTLPSVPPGGFVEMEYLYIVDNVGETDESITISDPDLCADVTATLGAFPGGIQFMDCTLCTAAPVGSVGPILLGPGDGMHAENCLIRFNSQAALRHFLALDNDREPCNDKDPGLSGDDCYRNCATASAVAMNLGDICRPPIETIIRDSFTTVCNSQCELDVRKQVRCLPDCDPTSLNGEVGWVEDPSQLDVAPGACLEYRIITMNTSPDDVLLCALKFNDLMSGAANFQSGPTDVTISRSCDNLDFSTAFNWDGDDVLCLLATPLAKNDAVTVRFRAQLKAADEIELNAALSNSVTVMGASETDCPDQGDPSFSCMDIAHVDIETLGCDFELAKDVTCDDPRSPGAVFASDMVDALPGSKVGFRIQIQNTGKVNLPRINITEDLTCSSWFVPGSVVADIDGADVTGCICPGGCNTIGALSGLKDLSGCGGFAPSELLTITFEVKVPANFMTMGTSEDCRNTVEVSAETDICSSDEKDPCPEREDFARINVDVPRIVCDKEVCADIDNNGNCDNGFNGLVEIDGPDADYPLSIIYRFTVTNTGEANLANARICDPNLIDDLSSLPPGSVQIGPCAINPATGCANLGALGTGMSAMATCTVRFEDEGAWFAFAALDASSGAECYSNSARAEADINPAGYCTREAGLMVQSSDCSARVCIGMPFIPTVSEWGLLILTLLLIVAYKIHFGARRQQLA